MCVWQQNPNVAGKRNRINCGFESRTLCRLAHFSIGVSYDAIRVNVISLLNQHYVNVWFDCNKLQMTFDLSMAVQLWALFKCT